MFVSCLSQMYQKIWISREYGGHMFFSFLYLIVFLQTQHRLEDFLTLLESCRYCVPLGVVFP